MSTRPRVALPRGEWRPQELCDFIRRWAENQGYDFVQEDHACEFAKVTIRDADGSHTTTVVPNAHHGRRLKRHQVRYTVQGVNNHWEEPRHGTR